MRASFLIAAALVACGGNAMDAAGGAGGAGEGATTESAITTLDLCGSVDLYTRASTEDAGALALSGQRWVVVAGGRIDGDELLVTHAHVCVRADVDGHDAIHYGEARRVGDPTRPSTANGDDPTTPTTPTTPSDGTTPPAPTAAAPSATSTAPPPPPPPPAPTATATATPTSTPTPTPTPTSTSTSTPTPPPPPSGSGTADAGDGAAPLLEIDDGGVTVSLDNLL